MAVFEISFLIVITLCIFLAFWIAYLLKKNVSAKKLYRDGIKALERSNFSKAKDFFLRAIAKKPDFIEALHRLGLLNFKLRDYTSAKSCFSKILESDHDNFVANYNLALVYQLQKDFEKAGSYYKKALSIEPKDIDSLFNMGIMLFEQKMFDEALEHFEKAKNLQPSNTVVLFYITRCKDELCDYVEGTCSLDIMNSYSEMFSKSDLPAEFLPVVAKAYARMGDIDKSVELCSKALELNEEDPEIYKLLGLIHLINNDVMSAKFNLTLAHQLDPESEEIYNILKYT